MKKVILNADDFGYSSGVNRGIIKSFQEGILSSTTLMANMPGCDEAIQLAKENPDLGVGCHLVLTCGKPMTAGATLTSENGKFYTLADYHENHQAIKDEEIFKEWCHQIDYLIDSGLSLTHLDSHHHVHTFSENLEITQAISQKYHLTFRNAYDLETQVHLDYQKGIKGFDDLMNYPAIRSMEKNYAELKNECLRELQAVLDKITDDVTELMVHPAFVDEGLYFGSSFNVQRMREVEILTDPEVKTLFDSANLEIRNYRNV